jgi:hypothetical protein
MVGIICHDMDVAEEIIRNCAATVTVNGERTRMVGFQRISGTFAEIEGISELRLQQCLDGAAGAGPGSFGGSKSRSSLC